MITLGIIAAVVRHGRDAYKGTVIVITVLAINAMMIRYEVYQYTIMYLLGLTLFFISATAMSYFYRSKRNKK